MEQRIADARQRVEFSAREPSAYGCAAHASQHGPQSAARRVTQRTGDGMASVQNKANWRRPESREPPYGKEVMSEPPCFGDGKTKPIYSRPAGRAIRGTDHAKRTQFRDCGLRIGNCGTSAVGGRRRPNARNPISATGARSRAGTPNLRRAETCETNPIWPGRKPVPKENVRNEAKLGATGVCGQRLSSCGACPGRGVKRAKRSQFLDCGLLIKRRVGRGRPTYEEPKRAERSQFARPGPAQARVAGVIGDYSAKQSQLAARPNTR
jgi:hypothetical protein